MSYEYGITKIQIRRDTSANFSSVNPILREGEPAIALDTNTLKIGDGVTPWASLSGISGGGITQEDLDDAISNIVDTAPETLNTLNELAAAINDNPNFFNEVAYSGGNITQFNNDANYVKSDTVGITGASGVNNIVQISQSDYDAIGSGNYDPNTIYFVP